MKTDFLSIEITELFPYLETILLDGGRGLHEFEGDLKTFSNLFGYSGFSFEQSGNKAEISLAMILGGTGLILRRTLNEKERYDYFNIQGALTFSADKEVLKPLIVDSYAMDLSSPILDHCYNFLSYEYKLASDGKSSTQMVYSLEQFLSSLFKSKRHHLQFKNPTKDSAIESIFNKILKLELDPVLTWEERQLVFEKHYETMNKIIATKTRAHKVSGLRIKMALMMSRLNNFFARVATRPQNNLTGILNKYTVGKVFWFFRTVKNNLGYSIALAVYGPFTYYFITMPMNPHAMQAVGRVRTAYLESKQELMSFIELAPKALNDLESKTAEATTNRPQIDSVNSISSGIDKNPKTNQNIDPNIIYPSPITTFQEPVLVTVADGKKQEANPSFLNMLLSTDFAPANGQSWVERMSSFKQMQIAYEENIEYASRMGRLEQLETQYNFPMQVEQTWEELERYNNLIFKLRTENPNLSAKMKQYLFNEVNRTQQLELYLWDRLGRFILDQVYVMLDQDKEQKRNDYYVGRSFILMQEMTQTLSWRYKDFKKPIGFDRIEKLASFYNKARKDFGSVTKNLAANSDLFKQKDIYNTQEFRSYMKRQWEILFLQNAKAEEASNMGLNMYIWSVRNTVWILQSIYATKREELALLIKRDTTGSLFTPEEMLARSKASMQYETLFHNLVLEYVGIREEIMNRLGKDIESAQRKVVIENLKESFSDREKLDGLSVNAKAESKNIAAGSTL
jgi:hypothetical protein